MEEVTKFDSVDELKNNNNEKEMMLLHWDKKQERRGLGKKMVIFLY